jgi:hypothetical protein
MGTQGLRGRAVFGRGGGDASWPRTIGLALSFAVLPLAAGCSQSSMPSFGSSAPQAAAVPPPPSGYAPAPGQPGYAPPPARPGYPPQASAGGAQPASYAPAQQPAPPADGTVGSVTSSYASFLKAFRDPDPDASAARASVYPQQSLADMFKASDSNQRPDPSGAGYPQQALVPSGGGAPPQQNAYVPHPPSTYTPSGQPYAPPPGQAGYAPPPATPQNYAAPPNPPRSGQQSSAKPSAQQTYAARSGQQSPPAQTAANSPPPPPPPTAAPAANREYSDSMPYPKQSLADMFSGSTQSQAQSVPRPPSTYAPSGQPYTPQGQAASAAPAASAPPASADASSSGPYPKQSLFDIFSSK